MHIKYLQQLSQHPSITSPDTGYVDKLEPLSMHQIEQLEQQYNAGRPFPAALRELLFLAGGSCYVLDYGLNDTQQEMQEDARSWLTEDDLNLSIPRPFYVIDVYNAGSQFLFVYLDEDQDNTMIYEAFLPDEEPIDTKWLRCLGSNLSSYIERGIAKLLKGYNPF